MSDLRAHLCSIQYRNPCSSEFPELQGTAAQRTADLLSLVRNIWGDAIKALGSNDSDEQKRPLDVKEKTSLSSLRNGSSCAAEI